MTEGLSRPWNRFFGEFIQKTKAAVRQLIDGAPKDAKSLDFEHRF